MASDRMPPRYDGPNADLVNEVLDLAFSDRILAAVGPDEEREDMLIITDMRRALNTADGIEEETHFARDRNLDTAPWGKTHVPTIDMLIEKGVIDSEEDLIDEQDDEDEENLPLTWRDLTSNLVACNIWTTEWYDWEKEHEESLYIIKSLSIKWTRDTPVPFEEHLRPLLPEGPPEPGCERGYYREYIMGHVCSDLMHCGQNRAYNGLTDNFWEYLLQIYMKGLWPCGWKGTWPAPGKLIAWRRSAAG